MDLLSYLGSILLSVIVFQFFQYCRREEEKARRQRFLEEENRIRVEQEKIKQEQEERKRQLEEENRKRVEQEKIRQEQERKRQLEEENRIRVEQEKIRQEQERKKQLEEENRIRVEQEKIRQEQERKRQLEEENRKRVEQEKIRQEQERKRQLEEENRKRVEQEKIRQEQERKRQLEEENRKRVEQEKIRQEQERKRQLEEENRKRVEQEKIRQELEERRRQQQYEEMIKYNQLKNIQKSKIQQHVQPIAQQTSIQQQIRSQPIKQQIQTLNQEINKLDNNNNLTNNQKQYYKRQYQQQLFTKLKDLGEAKSIPHVKQNIEASNPELAFYVLKESLLRDQNRELLSTSQQYSFGIDSILGAYGQDQSCLQVRNTNLDYDKIVNDNQLLEHHILEFKQKLSSSLNISIDQIEVLGVSKGSFEINFQITGNNMDEIQQQIKNKPEAQKFLNEYCNGQVQYVAYLDQASNSAKGVVLSFDDFNPQFNMSWDNFQEKEQRGPPYHRYDYYFPRGCYGFGLNVKKYEGSQDWILMNGNSNEWRIMYHGTKQQYASSIVKSNLQPGSRNLHTDDYDCMNGSGQVGDGIYFSDQYTVCVYDQWHYAPFTQVGNKQFAVIFMSRVNPKKIKQSKEMKVKNYFVVNNSSDVRPYRILLHEKK